MTEQEGLPMDQLTLFAEVQPALPADDEVVATCERARGRMEAAYGEGPHRRRRRRSAFALAGAGLLAAGASAAGVTVLAGSPAHSGTSLRTFVTADYIVRPAQDGTITVTIKELEDPAGLQRALAADGVNALVRYIPARNVSGTWHGSTYNGISPVCVYNNLPLLPGDGANAVGPDVGRQGEVFWIRPSALPKGAVVFIEDTPGGPGSGGNIFGIDVLKNSKLPRCVPLKPPTPQQIVSPQAQG